MVLEYLKRLRDGLTREMKKSEESLMFYENEKSKRDETLSKISKKIEQMSRLGYTKEDMLKKTESMPVFLPSKDKVLENIRNTPPIAPFSHDENGKLVPTKGRKL